MDLSMEFQSNKCCATVFSGTGRQAISTDFTLPDYCGDIERILHCNAAVQLHAVSENSDRLRAEGEIEIRLLYQSDEEKLAVFEQHLPLSVTLPVNEQSQNVLVRAKAAVDYLNCRALSPRKLNLNGSVSVQFEVLQENEETLVSSLAGCEVLPQQITVSSLVSLQQRSFDLSETVSLPAELPDVGGLIHVNGLPVIGSTEAVDDKLLLKGDLQLDVRYLTPEGTLQRMQHALPISQVLDAPGVSADSRLDISVDPLSVYAQPKRDGADDLRLLDFAVKLSVTIRAYETKTLTATVDCYAPHGYLQPQMTTRAFSTYLKQLQLSLQQEEMIETGLVRCEVLDTAILQIKPKTSADADTVHVESDVSLLLLVRDVNGGVYAFERSVTLNLTEPLHLDADDVRFSPQVHLQIVSAQPDADGNIRVVLAEQATGNLYAVQQISVLANAQMCENDAQPDCQLILSFAKAGEALWSIAKKYRSTVSLIQRENDLSDDVVAEDRLLLIPTAI